MDPRTKTILAEIEKAIVRFKMDGLGVLISGGYILTACQTGKQESLGTSDKHEAARLVQAKNENEAPRL